MDGQSNIPNEAGVPSVDTSNVVETAPVYTGAGPQRESVTPAPTTDENAEGKGDDVKEDAPNTDVTDDGAGKDTTTVTDDTAYQPKYTPEQITELAKQADYQPGEVEITFVDELGNFDPVAFGEFMKQNNQSVFNQAINAGKARSELTQIEGDTWSAVEKNFPEIAGNDSLTKALRGARIQDVLAGGDGDLQRIAKDIVGPIRDNKIKAVEDVNKTITEQKKLDTFTPDNAAPERAEPTLMQQLQSAVVSGDTAKAQALRHAIRKERIDANN